jgi:glycosyltransferase involved in cell wall biosynthesis
MKTIRLLAIIEATTITGPAKNLLQFAQCARSGGLDPAVELAIAVFQRGDGSTLFIDAAREASIPVYPILEAGRFDRAVLAQLSALVRQLKPDIIQSHAVKSHFAVRSARLHGMAPWIAFHHGYTWPDMRARVYNQFDRWSLRACARAVTVSQPFRRELTRIGVDGRRIEVVHNAIDPQWGSSGKRPENAAALRGSLGIDPNRKVILIVGRLSREKDHRTLLEALRRLRAADSPVKSPPAHLLVVGDGPERARIERAVRALEMSDAVTLTGQVSSAEPYYGIADLAVLSSLSEGSPNALLEAMAACVPVVATSVGGVPEIVSHNDSALLVPPRDCDAMARAIAALLSDGALAQRLAGRAHELALLRHAPAARARRLVELYRGVLGV